MQSECLDSSSSFEYYNRSLLCDWVPRCYSVIFRTCVLTVQATTHMYFARPWPGLDANSYHANFVSYSGCSVVPSVTSWRTTVLRKCLKSCGPTPTPLQNILCQLLWICFVQIDLQSTRALNQFKYSSMKIRKAVFNEQQACYSLWNTIFPSVLCSKKCTKFSKVSFTKIDAQGKWANLPTVILCRLAVNWPRIRPDRRDQF